MQREQDGGGKHGRRRVIVPRDRRLSLGERAFGAGCER